MMERAIALAEQGAFTARPNPCVGAVIEKAGVVLGEGLHWQAGLPHAEIAALNAAKAQGVSVEGATCYVTLEPCVHLGRTPPCVDALIAAKIAQVVIGSVDPNPLVAGQGIKALEAAGMTVILEPHEAAEALNQGFFSRMQHNRPWVRAKMAMSLDGRTAMSSGESQWITGETARLDGHRFRGRSGAILTSAKTVIMDNARLTVRKGLPKLPQDVAFEQPLRVILDQHLTLAPTADILHQPGDTWIVINGSHSADVKKTYLKAVDNAAVTLLTLPVGSDEHLVLTDLWSALAEQEINDVLVEAGPTLLGGLLKQQAIDEMLVYMAPKFLGHDGAPMAVIPALRALKEHIAGKFNEAVSLGSDLRLQMTL